MPSCWRPKPATPRARPGTGRATRRLRPDERRLLNELRPVDAQLAPDGETGAVVARRPVGGRDGGHGAELSIVSVADGVARRVLHDRGDPSLPRWSSDG